jgi:hypothetical protein
MAVNNHIYYVLSGTAGLTALVGTRIYPIVAPESPVYPLVTFAEIAHDKVKTSGGTSGNMNEALYQFSCWADTYASARAVANQVITALEDYSGTYDSTTIQFSYYDSENEMFEPTTKKFNIPIDFTIWYL